MSEPGSLIRTLSGRQSARNFHSYVIGEIGLGIVSGRFPVGSVLPGDAEMMDAWGVSRTVLREAIKTLEAKGLVEARAKVGTRVLPKNRWNLFDGQVLGWIHEVGPDRNFLLSFFPLRRLLEVQAAGLAARHRTAEQVRMMGYWLAQRQNSCVIPESYALAEFELHRTVCEASMNPFLRAATGIVEFGVITALVPRMTTPQADLAAEKSPLYQTLLLAVEQGRPDDATRAMEAVIDLDSRL